MKTPLRLRPKRVDKAPENCAKVWKPTMEESVIRRSHWFGLIWIIAIPLFVTPPVPPSKANRLASGATGHLAKNHPGRKIQAMLALTRVWGIDPFHRNISDPPVNIAQRDRILTALVEIDYGSLSEPHRQAIVRTYPGCHQSFRTPGK